MISTRFQRVACYEHTLINDSGATEWRDANLPQGGIVEAPEQGTITSARQIAIGREDKACQAVSVQWQTVELPTSPVPLQHPPVLRSSEMPVTNWRATH